MTSRDPWEAAGPDDPSLEETLTAPSLGELDAALAAGSGQRPGPADPSGALPPGPPAPPAAPPPWSTPAPPYAPGSPPAAAPGMTWAPPVETRPRGASGLTYAETLPRFVAYLVDGIVLSLVSWVLLLAMAPLGYDPFNLSGITSYSGFGEVPVPGVNPAAAAAYGALSAAISAAYFILQWSGAGRATVGMRLLKLQLGNAADGRTLTRGQAARRWLALDGWAAVLGVVPMLAPVIGGITLIWNLVLLVSVVSSPTKQGLHDRFAESAMVQPVGGSGNGLVVGCLVIVGILVAIVLISFVALIFLGAQVSTILETVGESI